MLQRLPIALAQIKEPEVAIEPEPKPATEATQEI